MRLSTVPERDAANGLKTIHAALDAGVVLFDTAHSYGLGDDDLGHNERLLAQALASHPRGPGVYVVTKTAMARPAGKWRPDGRAAVVRAHAEASVVALGRVPDLLLIHAPDPAVAWATTVRALAKAREDGLAKAVGLSNVNLAQLNEAIELAPIAAVQIGWSALEDGAVRSGVIERCLELGLEVIAYSPLGGPRHSGKLLRSPTLVAVAARHGVSPAVVALKALLDLHPSVTVIPGAKRPAAATEVAGAARLELTDADRAELREAFPALRPVEKRVRAAPTVDGEVVLIMGLQGSGKSTLVTDWVSRGYERLNRDLMGKTLKDVAVGVDRKLSEGVRRIVLDNTYVSRASRAGVLEVAAKHGVGARGVWIDVPLHEASVNVIWRMLDAHRRLLSPEELRKGKDNTMLPPHALLRMAKELELPVMSEGFTALETRAFVRTPRGEKAGRFVAVDVKDRAPKSELPTLFFGWQDAEVTGAAICLHGGGPPSCWCRPPLPGLLLAFAFEHGLDPARCEVLGSSEAHRVMAATLGARFVEM
jgi:aryl-alcohol dehydrogenase-like predicted oxidoreductase/predicted kinase